MPKARTSKGPRLTPTQLKRLGEDLVFDAGMDWARGGDLGHEDGLVLELPAGQQFLWLFDAWVDDCVPDAHHPAQACFAGHLEWVARTRKQFGYAAVGYVPGDGQGLYGVSWALVPLDGGAVADLEWSWL